MVDWLCVNGGPSDSGFEDSIEHRPYLVMEDEKGIFNIKRGCNVTTSNEQPAQSFLDARAKAKEIMEQYQNDPKQESFNLLLLGEMGSGKTFLTRTARKPVHIDSFDPGATKGLIDYIKKGEIIVDSRYEAEDPTNPKYCPIWARTMDARIKSNYFSHIGTYVIDSSTMWSEMIMNDILRKAGIAGSPPRWSHDYQPHKTAIRNYLRKCLDLPCDFILTGHLLPTKEESSGQIVYRFNSTGNGAIFIPTLFDEVWIMEPKETSKGVEYRILTQSTGKYVCRSRFSQEGKLDKYEPADIKHILKKCGRNYNDKPSLIE